MTTIKHAMLGKRSIRFLALGAVSTTALQAGMALGVATALFAPLAASAQQQQQTQPQSTETTLGTVKVQSQVIDPNPNAEVGVPYKAKTSGDERHTRPLAETPQTITVLTKAQIDDSGYTDLAEILDAQPGITLGTGENGNAFGDRYIIRGQEARSDVFVDGLRDPGMTIRESFAVEQIEISKGANSAFAGRGTAGGGINAITKAATTDYTFAKFSAGVGTDEHSRLTLDFNQAFSPTFALRANALYGYEVVPGSDPANRERHGLALSGLYTPTDDLEVIVDYYGLLARDNPDIGSYLSGTVPNRFPASPVPPIVAQAQDFLESNVNTGTGRIKYQIAPDLRITNILRVANSENGYVVTGTNGATTGTNNPGGVYTTNTLSTHNGWQDVDYLANQTNLFWSPTFAGMKHDLIFSFEYTDHHVLNGVYNVTNSGQNCITGNGTVKNNFCARDSAGNAVPGLRTLMNRQIAKGNFDIDWAVNTTSAALMDTVDLGYDFTAFGGVRADWFDYTLVTQNTNTLAKVTYPYSDSIANGQFGLVYKINEMGNVYASFSTGVDINGGESDVGTSSGYGGVVVFNGSIAGAKPETSMNIEVGSKWNLFDDTLLATIALFQNTKRDVMEGADYTTFGTFNTGESRVEGVELDLSGKLTDDLTISAGFTLMNSEILKSATPANVGKALSNFAKSSGNLMLKYQLTDDLSIGGALKYESRRFGGQPDTAAVFSAAGYAQPVPSYIVGDLFANYRFNENVSFRLNVNNIADTEYYTAVYRAGFFLYRGEARSFRVTLNYDL